MAILRKKVPARPGEVSQQSTGVESISGNPINQDPLLAWEISRQSTGVVEKADESEYRAPEAPTQSKSIPEVPELIRRTKNLTVSTSQTPTSPARKPIAQVSIDDFVQSPTPTSATTSDGFYQSPTAMTPSDAFFQSPTSTMTSSDAFQQTPATSINSDDFLQSPLSTSTSTTSDSQNVEKSKWKSALEDAQIFAGGLLRHPFESTKHFTILRHSGGLVYYKGPDTNIALTILADKPLSPDRRLWLQMKGWTGKTGMRAKALLRTNGSWIEVTPSTRIDAAQLPPMNERAWQRDIKKFLNKAPKSLRKHAVRETAVLRIPFEAVDGYFRVVLTGPDNKNSLCPSPVFRVASTSMSASSIKGASLSTLPVELGVKILQYTAKQTASNAVVPLGNTIRQQVAPYMPSFWVQEAATTAYDIAGVQNKFDTMNDQYTRSREITGDPNEPRPYIGLDRPDIIGDPSGPDPPFPLHLDGKVVAGTGKSTELFGMPTANLTNIPDDIIAPLYGTYFGWALIKPHQKEEQGDDLQPDWHHAIISIAPCTFSAPTIAPKKIVKVYLIHDFAAGASFLGAKISLVLMGFLRPCIPFSEKEAFFYETYRDVAITQASLDREEWGPDVGLERIRSARSARGIGERYVDARRYGQRYVDRVPVHRLGVRMSSVGFKDRVLFGKGGLYVVRSAD